MASVRFEVDKYALGAVYPGIGLGESESDRGITRWNRERSWNDGIAGCINVACPECRSTQVGIQQTQSVVCTKFMASVVIPGHSNILD